jgi:hypothetical protein
LHFSQQPPPTRAGDVIACGPEPSIEPQMEFEEQALLDPLRIADRSHRHHVEDERAQRCRQLDHRITEQNGIGDLIGEMLKRGGWCCCHPRKSCASKKGAANRDRRDRSTGPRSRQ